MGRQEENVGFICAHCGLAVAPLAGGGYRNHCPRCLHSRHVDRVPGDRAEVCGGLMAPVGLTFRGGKGWQIVHRCRACGVTRPNRSARGAVQPDDLDALARLPAWQG